MKMKPAIAIRTILVSVLTSGLALAQNPTIIQNTRNTMNGVSANSTEASNAALGANQPASGPTSISMPVGTGSGAGMSGKSSSGKSSSGKSSSGKSSAGTKHKGGAAVAGTQSASARPGVIAKKEAPVAAAPAGSGAEEGENLETEQSVVPDAKYAANGRRDPFLSPVVSHTGGSGCSTGKKCLEIGNINLRGVVRSENGFIAVVSNNMNKAYFLRENDPVFNGYVVKITGDSIVFQETLQDRLGKTFTREVVKKITTPAV
jgi:Tfp pilus assembly protein PilP